jgi:hypothetical protein
MAQTLNLQITREDEGDLIVLCVQGDISSVNAEVLEAAQGYHRREGASLQGMILAADGPDGKAILLTPEAEAPEGTSVH